MRMTRPDLWPPNKDGWVEVRMPGGVPYLYAELGLISTEDACRLHAEFKGDLQRRGVSQSKALDLIREGSPLPVKLPGSKKEKGPGHVYALRAGPHVKIGYTAGPIANRMRELSTGCPYDIVCIGWQEGGMGLENALHRYFAAHRTHGEWFVLAPIEDAIERLLPRKLGAWGEPV